MAVLGGPVLVLDGAQCAALHGALTEAIQLGYITRGILPPRVLVEHSDEVAIIARGAGQRRADASFPQVTPGVGAADLRAVPGQSSSQEPVTLTIGEAARWAGISEGHMRSLCRRGDVHASRAGRSAWAVDVASVWAWMVGHNRTEPEQRAS